MQRANRTKIACAVRTSCRACDGAAPWFIAPASADSDGSGQLDSGEVAGFLAAQGVEMPSGFVEELMRTHDTDGSGKIDLPEFQRLMERAQNWLNPLGVKK